MEWNAVMMEYSVWWHHGLNKRKKKIYLWMFANTRERKPEHLMPSHQAKILTATNVQTHTCHTSVVMWFSMDELMHVSVMATGNEYRLLWLGVRGCLHLRERASSLEREMNHLRQWAHIWYCCTWVPVLAYLVGSLEVQLQGLIWFPLLTMFYSVP